MLICITILPARQYYLFVPTFPSEIFISFLFVCSWTCSLHSRHLVFWELSWCLWGTEFFLISLWCQPSWNLHELNDNNFYFYKETTRMSFSFEGMALIQFCRTIVELSNEKWEIREVNYIFSRKEQNYIAREKWLDMWADPDERIEKKLL